MPKDSAVAELEEEFDEYELEDEEGFGEESSMFEMVSHLTEIERLHTDASVELTRLILEKATDAKLKEAEILATFNKIKEMLASSSSAKEIFDKMIS